MNILHQKKLAFPNFPLQKTIYYCFCRLKKFWVLPSPLSINSVCFQNNYFKPHVVITFVIIVCLSTAPAPATIVMLVTSRVEIGKRNFFMLMGELRCRRSGRKQRFQLLFILAFSRYQCNIFIAPYISLLIEESNWLGILSQKRHKASQIQMNLE